MKNIKSVATLFVALAISTAIHAQTHAKDSIGNAAVDTKEMKNRNVMLNASDASKPREVNIGLPETVGGTEIFEDGMPVSYYFWPHMAYTSWRGGVSYDKTGLLSLSESALLSGNVGYTVNSFTRLGTDKLGTHLDYTLNHFGAQKMDLNVAGKIARNWYFSLGSFQNFDTGSTDLKFLRYQDRTQIYKGTLTHRWDDDKGEVSLFFKHSNTISASDRTGPFYYETDGSVELMSGFDLGHDSYLPDGRYRFMDVKTGVLFERSMSDGNSNRANEITLSSNYAFDNGAALKLNLKYSHANTSLLSNNLTGLSKVTEEQGYTQADGTPFVGYVQSRYTPHQVGKVNDILATAEYATRINNHGLRIGLNQWYNTAELTGMTVNWAQTAEANPTHLFYNGKEFWSFNTAAEYYKGRENKLALYLSDNWQALHNLNITYGMRLEYYHIDGHSPMNITASDHNNNRVEGFYLGKEGVRQTDFNHNWLNPIGTVGIHYSVFKNFGFTGDYLFNRQRTRLEDFAGKDQANLNPVDVHLGRLGIYYNNDWLNLVSTFSYIRKTNYKSRSVFTANVNGIDETQVAAINYDIATMGWTTDAIIKPFEGFQLHYLFTWQNPQYKKFNTTLTFSDNSPRSFSFDNKVVTGVSQILMEIDPSYNIDNWRFWLSFRYFGKQYINKPNTLSFKSRWETFGGIDYKLNEHIAFSANVINFLNQKGASGSISAADLITDSSVYNHYLISGTSIRPFTTEFSVKINF